MTDEIKNINLEGLARMIKKGFDENTEQHTQIFKRFDKVETSLTNLEQGQEEIKLKLDQVAYRFEVQELDRRLKIVEAKLGLQGAEEHT